MIAARVARLEAEHARDRTLRLQTLTASLAGARTLDDIHNQVEGVAITRDDVLILSDEVGKQKPAAITLYRLR